MRHAEPATTGRLLGRTDPPLSEAGRREAQVKLGGLQVEEVWTSPLRRCVGTAEQIRGRLRVHEGLSEIGLGSWDGLSWTEIEARDPELSAKKVADWKGVTPPGGEPWDHFEDRVNHALALILARPAPMAIVGHVAVNSVIAATLTGADPVRFVHAYCEVLEFELREEDVDIRWPRDR